MKASRSAKKQEQVELTGKVVQKTFAKGSKSEHETVCFETDQGSFVLRRHGANPFSDPVLQKLIGKTVKAKGMITDYLFLANTVKNLSR